MFSSTARSVRFPLALLSVCALSACGKQGIQASSCTKTGAQTLMAGNLSLADVPPASSLDPLPAKTSVSDPRMLGGAVQMKHVDKSKQPNVAMDAFSATTFPGKASCSAVLEVRQEAGAYKIDAFTNSGCIIQKLIYQGSQPSIGFFRPQTAALLDGYESVPVTFDLLDERDEMLKKLEGIPGVSREARKTFMRWGINTERVVHARYVSKDGDATLAADLCLKIPDSARNAYDALSAAEKAKIEDPIESITPQPPDCQMLLEGHWFTFKVPAAAATEKKALLDELVIATKRYKEFQAKRAAVPAYVKSVMDSLRSLSDESNALEQKSRRLRLAVFAMGAADSNTTPDGRSLAGEGKEGYVSLAKTMFASAHAAEIEASKVADYSAASRQPMKDRYTASLVPSYAKTLAYLNALHTVQVAMKAKFDRVGIATNHIAHWDGKKVNSDGKQYILQFKDLALRPADMKVPEELSRHAFDFASEPFLKAGFDASLKHSLINNLRDELNDGYAITFAGSPIGAVRAETDQSGGASVINLPARSKNTTGSGSSGEASKDRDGKRQTTDAGC